MRVPERIHFFSYATGVSLELPAGFTGGGQGDGAVYVHRDDEVPDAVVIVTVVGTAPPGAGDADAAGMLADAMAATAGEVLERRQHDIDDEPVWVAVLRFPDGLPARGAAAPGHPELARLLEGDVLVTFAAVAFAGRIVTITATAPYQLAAQFRPVFEQALESCRFIEGVPA